MLSIILDLYKYVMLPYQFSSDRGIWYQLSSSIVSFPFSYEIDHDSFKQSGKLCLLDPISHTSLRVRGITFKIGKRESI